MLKAYAFQCENTQQNLENVEKRRESETKSFVSGACSQYGPTYQPNLLELINRDYREQGKSPSQKSPKRSSENYTCFEIRVGFREAFWNFDFLILLP